MGSLAPDRPLALPHEARLVMEGDQTANSLK